jgi:nicotinamide-nucleotide amidase
MKAEIIAIGSELTSGAKLDTNSQWLSRELGDLGIPVGFHTTVADDLADNVAAIRIALERADVVVITGGLGPTLDDLTRQALADSVGVELRLDPPSLTAIRDMFARRGRTMPERNEIQAWFPEGSTPLPNPVGTAPGIWMEIPRHNGRPPGRVAALPGVPSEMYRMFADQVRPRLPASGTVIRHARIHCFGLGESHTEQLLGDLTARGREPEVGITAHEATITLRITSRAGTAGEAQARLQAASDELRRRLGHYVFGTEDDELEDVVVRALTNAGKTVCAVEWGSGGLLCCRLTEAAGLDACFLGGVVLSTRAALLRELDPPLRGDLIANEQTTAALARTARTRTGADFALAVTVGSPAELPAHGGVDAPDSFVAVATATTIRVVPVQRLSNPAIHISRTVKTALDLLRLELQGSDRGQVETTRPV